MLLCANMLLIRLQPGKERDIVFSLMRKAVDLEYSNHPLQILSAFQRDSLQGMIYVEARSAVASEMIRGYNHRLKGKLRHIGAHIPRYLTFAHDFALIRSSFTTMTCRGRYPLRAVSGL